MACESLPLTTRARLALAFAPDEKTPLRITLLRKAAWRGFLVPTCNCKPPELIMKQAWLVCAHCGAKTKPLESLERLAKTLDEALLIAIKRAEQ